MGEVGGRGFQLLTGPTNSRSHSNMPKVAARPVHDQAGEDEPATGLG